MKNLNIRDKIKGKEIGLVIIFFVTLGLISLLGLIDVNATDPVGPDTVTHVWNQTKNDTASAYAYNISGGYIGSFNVSVTQLNSRWKAFVGHLTGKFTLDDANGSSIYDWAMTTTTGRVYATTNATSIIWSNINCSNFTYLEEENNKMSHTNPNDNITVTFDWQAPMTHDPFYVGGEFIAGDTCPTLNTYVANASQDTVFEEMALYDGVNTVYSTIVEDDVLGYDNFTRYDFQMIVPENGSAIFTGSTAYYIYVELGN